MLEQLLQMMVEGSGAAAVPELARRLGVSARLVEQMIAQLVRLGYLEAVEPGCAGGACRGCAMAAGCAAQPQARLWAATEKGRRLLRRGTA